MAGRPTTTTSCGGATFVAYYRVSTQKQGRSGLGLEAQREDVQRFVAVQSGRLVAEFQETASGAKAGRIELARALERCRRENAILVVAHVDRLARSTSLLPWLEGSGVHIVACDMPAMDRLGLFTEVAKAEEERRLASVRTKAALQAAKARGVRLGNPLGAAAFGERSRAGATEALQAKADSFAEGLAGIVLPLHGAGLSLRKIAERLNAEGIVTAQGKAWQANSVKRLIDRLTARREG